MSQKIYSASVNYETKLKRVIERIGADNLQYDWTQGRSSSDCYIQFRYKGHTYRFEHSLEKAKASGQDIRLVSDLFAQLVLTIEDIARAAERGIYDLTAYISSFKSLPTPNPIPNCFLVLGYTDIPTDIEDVKQHYKNLAKAVHPDVGGNAEQFVVIKAAYEQACEMLKNKQGGEEH